MKFSDLTEWDINLIKSKAINLLVTTKCNSRYSVLLDTVIGCIECKGFKLLNFDDKLKQVILKNITPEFHNREPIRHPPTDDVISLIFTQLEISGVHIERDGSKIITWNQPSDAWHNRVKTYKPPWVM